MKPRPASKNDIVRVRVESIERQAFDQAAQMSGLTLSAWVRLAARELATRQLANAGQKPGWIK